MLSIRKRREKVGMTISDLSRKTGVSANFISEIETGRHTCSFETLEKLVFALSDYSPKSTYKTATPARSRSNS